MASGNPVVEFLKELPTATVYATDDIRAGGSTPAESLELADFDAGTIEYRDYLCRLSEDYDSGGLTFQIGWGASSATSGVCRWGIAIRAIPDDAEDIDGSHTYDFNDADCTAAGAAGRFVYDSITFTDGADMDSWAAGQLAIVRLRRNASHVNDTMTGDAELASLHGRET